MNNKILQLAVVLSLIAAGFFALMLITRVIGRRDLDEDGRPQPAAQSGQAEK